MSWPRLSPMSGTPALPLLSDDMRHEPRHVAFCLDERRYGLAVSAVEQIHRMVEITALPKAPGIVLGIVNIRGRIVPVLDIRNRFGHPGSEVSPGDLLIVARLARRSVALAVDAVEGVVESDPGDLVEADDIVPGIEFVQGVAKLGNGMLLIHDLDRFLSLEEVRALDEVIPNG